jgi:2-oxoglutarate dehydrogenase E1 component
MDRFSFLNAINIDFISDLYEQYRANPDAIDANWRAFFQGYDFAQEEYNGDTFSEGNSTVSNEIPEKIHKEFQVLDLVNAYRTRGHLFTKTNPVRSRRAYTPNLEIENFGLTKADLDTVFDAGDVLGIGSQPLHKIIAHLDAIYCESIGVEYMYIRNPEEIKWWQNRLHTNDNHPKYTVENKKYILSKLNHAVTFEQFLQTKYVGQKRFSVEGGETLIPAMSVALYKAARTFKVKEVVIGMAHRGRLNVLTNIFRKPVREVFSEFEGKDFNEKGIAGDVKYHLGLTLDKTYNSGEKILMNLVPNPSHLETVDAVAEGIARARIDKAYNGDNSQLLPILIHGDAAVAGQGIVYEVLQMSKLKGYETGGTLHIVVNNQIGFTTNYLDARSSTYCTDIAKVTLSPVLHVNADDAEAVVHAVEMALEFRMKFKRDIFIDLLGYRKYGHNEGDEPRFTQPNLYKAIAKQENPFKQYADKLIAEGTIDAAYAKQIVTDFKATLEESYQLSKKDKHAKIHPFMDNIWKPYQRADEKGILKPVKTAYPKNKLAAIGKVISEVPEGVKFIRKAERILRTRAKAIFEDNKIDWGIAESLAYGSLLEEGYDIRISGEDVERGTFSHRHAILRDEISEDRINLLNTNSNNKGEMEIYNSLLSEYGVVGFDYGYAMATPNTLTIWEAQFGDFANGAQIIFDQYLSAAEDKWKQQNGLVILLPHGYEGQGSEHSSGRMERFLQLCAIDNMIVTDCTTPANIYHLLRRQMKTKFRKPLIVFTPKSLLRHPKAISTLEELAKGSFETVIDDSIVKKEVTKLVFCTGKFYYDLLAKREEVNNTTTALVRLEQLFPLDKEKITKIIASYPNAKEYIWAQEEPKNMGAASHMMMHFDLVPLKIISRPLHASPAAGSSSRAKRRHDKVINEVFGL